MRPPTAVAERMSQLWRQWKHRQYWCIFLKHAPRWPEQSHACWEMREHRCTQRCRAEMRPQVCWSSPQVRRNPQDHPQVSCVTSSCSTGSVCKNCDAGTYSDAKAPGCIDCGAGTYSGGAKASGCIDCGAGTYSGNKASVCVNCGSGTYSSAKASRCIDCGTGTYSATRATVCIDCASGSYSNNNKATKCTFCSGGQYQPEAGKTECKTSCGPGKYSTSTGRSAAVECTSCPGGFFGAMFRSNCPNCPNGQFQASEGKTNCIDCDVGTYGLRGVGQRACYGCRRGTFEDKVGSSYCKPCPKGRFSSVPAATTATVCEICTPGTFSLQAATICTDCRAGTRSSGNGNGECSQCPPGTFSRKKATMCQTCEKQKVATEGSATCLWCDPGQVQPDPGKSKCVKCAAGQTSEHVYHGFSRPPQQSWHDCWDCPSGYVAEIGGSRACLACPVGKFANSTGSVTCQNCSAGRYNDLPAETKCRDCVQGTAVGHGINIACFKCDSGTFGHIIKASICKMCPSGTFTAANLSSTVCKKCPMYTFQAERGRSKCDLCKDPLFAYSEGQDACDQCIDNKTQLILTGHRSAACRLEKACPWGVLPTNFKVDVDLNFSLPHCAFRGTEHHHHLLIAYGSHTHFFRTSFVHASTRSGLINVASGGSFEATECSFSAADSLTQGGLLYLQPSARVALNDCTFSSNSADQDGGSIFLSQSAGTDSLAGSRSTTLFVHRCKFQSNSAKSGGAIAVGHSSTTAAVDLMFLGVRESTFLANVGQDQGGAIAATVVRLHHDGGGHIPDLDPRFARMLQDARYSPRSGLLVAIDASFFQSNSASNSGYAMHVKSTDTLLKSCSFSNARGTTIVNRGHGTLTLLEGCSFAGTASRHIDSTTLVHAQDSQLLGLCTTDFGSTLRTLRSFNFTPAVDCRIESNSHSRVLAVSQGTALVLGGVVFGSNQHGAILLEPNSFATVTRCSFHDNGATSGAAISSLESALDTVCDIAASTFAANRASVDGGAVLVAEANIFECVFMSNFAGNTGGALYIDSRIVISGQCFFWQNRAVHHPNLYMAAPLFVTQEELTNACVVAGSIPSELHTTGRVRLMDCAIEGTKSTRLVTLHSGTDAIVHNVTFWHGAKSPRGGAIHAHRGANFQASQSTFMSNAASQFGGAIMMPRNSSFAVEACFFLRNVGLRGGGGISVEVNARVTLSRSTFMSNTARTGGGLFSNSTLHFSSPCYFAQNHATESFSELFIPEFKRAYIRPSPALLVILCQMRDPPQRKPLLVLDFESLFDLRQFELEWPLEARSGILANFSMTSNVALHVVADASVQIEDGQIGALRQGIVRNPMRLGTRSSTKFRQCRFEAAASRSAGAIGGAVSSLEAALFNAVSCTFEQNRAVKGGAVGTQGTRATQFARCVFVRNVASVTGGAIFTDGALIVTASSFIANKAPKGKSIFFAGSTLQTNMKIEETFFSLQQDNVNIDSGRCELRSNTGVGLAAPGMFGTCDTDTSYQSVVLLVSMFVLIGTASLMSHYFFNPTDSLRLDEATGLGITTLGIVTWKAQEMFGVSLIYFDLVSDLLLCHYYYTTGHRGWAMVAVVMFVVSTIVHIMFVSTSGWTQELSRLGLRQGLAMRWTTNVFVNLFGLTPLLVLVARMRLPARQYASVACGDSSTDMLQVLKTLEAVFESMPQILLQVYILLHQFASNLTTNSLQWASAALSVATATHAFTKVRLGETPTRMLQFPLLRIRGLFLTARRGRMGLVPMLSGENSVKVKTIAWSSAVYLSTALEICARTVGLTLAFGSVSATPGLQSSTFAICILLIGMDFFVRTLLFVLVSPRGWRCWDTPSTASATATKSVKGPKSTKNKVVPVSALVQPAPVATVRRHIIKLVSDLPRCAETLRKAVAAEKEAWQGYLAAVNSATEQSKKARLKQYHRHKTEALQVAKVQHAWAEFQHLRETGQPKSTCAKAKLRYKRLRAELDSGTTANTRTLVQKKAKKVQKGSPTTRSKARNDQRCDSAQIMKIALLNSVVPIVSFIQPGSTLTSNTVLVVTTFLANCGPIFFFGYVHGPLDGGKFRTQWKTMVIMSLSMSFVAHALLYVLLAVAGKVHTPNWWMMFTMSETVRAKHRKFRKRGDFSKCIVEAICRRDVLSLQLLISLDADVNGANPDNKEFILHCACRHNADRCVDVLLGNGALSHNTKAETGESALHIAGFAGSIESLRILIHHRAQTTRVDNSGRTALHAAALGGCAKTVLYLIHAGLNPNAQDMDGRTPAHLAAVSGHHEALKALRQWVDCTVLDNNGMRADMLIPNESDSAPGAHGTTLSGAKVYADNGTGSAGKGHKADENHARRFLHEDEAETTAAARTLINAEEKSRAAEQTDIEDVGGTEKSTSRTKRRLVKSLTRGSLRAIHDADVDHARRLLDEHAAEVAAADNQLDASRKKAVLAKHRKVLKRLMIKLCDDTHDEEDLRTAFDRLDADGDGAIDADELVQLARSMNLPLGKRDAVSVVQLLDRDGDGHVHWHELHRHYVEQQKQRRQSKLELQQMEEAAACRRSLARSGSGALSVLDGPPVDRRLFSTSTKPLGRLKKRASIDVRRESRRHLTDETQAKMILEEYAEEQTRSRVQLAEAKEESAELGAHKRLLKEIRHKTKEVSLRSILADLQLSNARSVSMDDAVRLVESIVERPVERGMVEKTLARCDRDGDGQLDRVELEALIGGDVQSKASVQMRDLEAK